MEVRTTYVLNHDDERLPLDLLRQGMNLLLGFTNEDEDWAFYLSHKPNRERRSDHQVPFILVETIAAGGFQISDIELLQSYADLLLNRVRDRVSDPSLPDGFVDGITTNARLACKNIQDFIDAFHEARQLNQQHDLDLRTSAPLVMIGRVLEAHDNRFWARKQLKKEADELGISERDLRAFGMYEDCGPSYESMAEESRGSFQRALKSKVQSEKRFKKLKATFVETYPHLSGYLEDMLSEQIAHHAEVSQQEVLVREKAQSARKGWGR